MPTILKIKDYRFFFFSLEAREPPHIHMYQVLASPINLASSYGFKSHELAKIREMVVEHSALFLEKWHDFFGNKVR